MRDFETAPEALYEDLDEHLAALERGLLALERSPEGGDVVDTVFRAAHSIKGASGTFGLHELARFTHLVEGVLERLREGSLAYEASTADVLLRSLDTLRGLVDAARRGVAPPSDASLSAELVVLAPPRETDQAIADCGFEIFDAPAAQTEQPATSARGLMTLQSSTIRVATEKVDGLLDLVGELVISHSVIRETLRASLSGNAARLEDALAAMDRNTRELQERVMAIRMVPLSTVFGRLPRMARDLGETVGKRVQLVIEGEATEIDKSMVERLTDPMMHLVRNAIDHGLESPDERDAAGKSALCTVSIRASHRGGSVVVEVEDDGRGLPTEAIREKAVRQGLVAPDAVLSDAEVHQLICTPGFSTAAAVTSVSGRGVGMDVVKRNVDDLSGSLALSSTAGKGTLVTLKLPLTLSILDGLAVRVGEQTFVIPLLSAVESFRPTASQLRRLPGRSVGAEGPQVIDVRGAALPVVRLHQVFSVPAAVTDPCRGIVCVLEADGGRVAALVDELVGQVQVVVKNLESSYGAVPGIMGATILGNGRVSMIVDVQALFRAARGPSAHVAATSLHAPREESCPQP